MSLALDQLSEVNDGEVVSFFDAPFTASSNNMLQGIYADGNVPPSVRLLLFISRYSTGYLKPEVILKESFVLKETGMSRSSLYKAKKELLESGKITIGHTKAGNCVYRLAPDLQCLKGATSARQRASQRWGSASGDDGGPQLETPHVHKEHKENLDQHQSKLQKQNLFLIKTPDDVHSQSELIDIDTRQPLPVSTTEKYREIQQTIAPATKTTFSVPILNETQLALVDRLRQHAIGSRIAENLVKTNPSDIIEKALAGLNGRKEIINPAGWLVREIQSGGYAPPSVIVAGQARRAIELARVAERETVEAERERQNQAANADLAELNQLNPERHTELLEAARSRMAWVPRAATAGPDNPFIRGAMLDLLREVRQRR